ncbi:MAG: glycosyltransferase family 1 protein, partial [Deltaproteobacteria bacterium]
MSYTKSECPTVVYVGRIKAYKRLDHLIKAFKIVKDEVENCKLIIAGKGNQKPLKKLALELGFNSSVEFYGEVLEDEKLRLLR